MAGTTRSTKKTARSPSPAKATPKVKSEKKPRASSSKKKKEEAVAAIPMVLEKISPEKKVKERKKKEPKKEEIIDEEITSIESNDDMGAALIVVDGDLRDAPAFVQDTFMDITGVHNVIRIQYIQMYALGLALMGSAFSPALSTIPLFAGTSELIQAVAGAFCFAQAFSLTAAAQTSFSPMKKTLQYNMVFHMLFALAVILKHDSKFDANHVQILVGVSLVNVSLNMWACYFRKNELSIEDEESD